MKKSLLLCLAVILALGTVGSVVPVSAQGVWTVWQDSVFVGNERVFRVAPTDQLSALERTALINQRLAVLQENYPGFDPKRIGIIGFWSVPGKQPRSALETGCSDTTDFNKDVYKKAGSRRYLVIGYFRAPDERPFSGEMELGSYCAYRLADDSGYFKQPKFFAYFIPIVTVTPQDAKLHGWGIYEINLAMKWAWNLRNAFTKTR